MFQVQECLTSGWQPVERGTFRTLLKAVTAARSRTAQQGTTHRVVDLSLKAVAEIIPQGSIASKL